MFIFNSCLKVVQENFSEIDKKPVLNAILVAGDTIKVHVSLTGKVDNSNYIPIENAQVFLYANNEFLEILNYTGNSFYKSNIIAKPGIIYKCELIIPEYENVESYCKIPELISISDVQSE